MLPHQGGDGRSREAGARSLPQPLPHSHAHSGPLSGSRGWVGVKRRRLDGLLGSRGWRSGNLALVPGRLCTARVHAVTQLLTNTSAPLRPLHKGRGLSPSHFPLLQEQNPGLSAGQNDTWGVAGIFQSALQLITQCD